MVALPGKPTLSLMKVRNSMKKKAFSTLTMVVSCAAMISCQKPGAIREPSGQGSVSEARASTPPGPAAMPSGLAMDQLVEASPAANSENAALEISLPQAVTGASINAALKPIIAALESLAATLGGDVSIVAGGLKTQLDVELDHLNGMLHNEVNVPIANLGLDVQDVSRQLLSTVERVDFLLKGQQKCATQNLGTLLAALQTVMLETKSGIPFVHAGAARLDYFQFAGHAANVVPSSGGRLTIRGFRLWGNPRPVVDIRDDSRAKVLAVLAPEAADNTNSLSVMVDKATIAASTGKCLQLHVQTFRQGGLLGKRVIPVADMYEPMCVPSEYGASLQLTASVAFTCPNTQVSTLEQKVFYFDNTSCDQRKTVTHTERWVMPSDGCSILSTNDSPGALNRNQSNIVMSPGYDSVTAAGWIDPATCFSVPFVGAKLLHSSEWQRLASPKIKCPTHDQRVTTSTSPDVPITASTQICVDLDKTCNEPGSQFWFSLRGKASGMVPQEIYSSPRTVVGTASASPVSVTVPVGNISASYTAPPVNGKSQVCVTIKGNSCDY